MSEKMDYWEECIAIAAEECGLVLTKEQLDALAGAAESGHEHYGMAFYSPPASDRISDIEDEWKRKVKDKEEEHQREMKRADDAAEESRWRRDRQIQRLRDELEQRQ